MRLLVWPFDIFFGSISNLNLVTFFISNLIYIIFESLPGGITTISVPNPIASKKKDSNEYVYDANSISTSIDNFNKATEGAALSTTKNNDNSSQNNANTSQNNNTTIGSILDFVLLVSKISVIPIAYLYNLLHPQNTSSSSSGTTNASSSTIAKDPLFDPTVETISMQSSYVLKTVLPILISIGFGLFITSFPFLFKVVKNIRIYAVGEIFYDFWYDILLTNIMLTIFYLITLSTLSFVRYVFNVIINLSGLSPDNLKWGVYLVQIFVAFNLTKWVEYQSCGWDVKAFIQTYLYPKFAD